MTYWRGTARWINVVLVVVLGVLALDALSRLLDADGSSPPAVLVRALAVPARAPIAALPTALHWAVEDLLAALVWILLALVLLVIVRSVQLAGEPDEASKPTARAEPPP